jgi:hypothetical protein
MIKGETGLVTGLMGLILPIREAQLPSRSGLLSSPSSLVEPLLGILGLNVKSSGVTDGACWGDLILCSGGDGPQMSS